MVTVKVGHLLGLAEPQVGTAQALKGLRNIPVSASLAINRLLAKIDAELKPLSATRNEILAEYGTPVEDKPDAYDIIPGSVCQLKIIEFADNDIEIEATPVVLPPTVEGLSAFDLEILEGLVVIDGEEG